MVRSDSLARYDIINYLIKKYNYKSYLEIGVQYEDNWSKVICDIKIGVDPERGGTHRMTSDDFFKDNKEKFDIIFIDGLHHADQVKKDIINSLDILNNIGTIICHDMIPLSYESQVVPRRSKHWNGDCWKAFVHLKQLNLGLSMQTIQTDCGLGVIRRIGPDVINMNFIENHLTPLTYEDFLVNQKELLGVITCEEFLELY
jgi:hypothetical protein